MKSALESVESAVDRVLTKRLRLIRDDTRAIRTSIDEQVELRVQAELRAADAERRAAKSDEQAAALRLRVSELEGIVAEAESRPAGLFRRRRRLAVQG